MIDLQTAAIIAKTASDAVGAFDRIVRGYLDVVSKKEPSPTYVPPPDFAYLNAPERSAIVAQSRQTGHTYQAVTYDELRNRLQGNDLEYIQTQSQAMQMYEHQWNNVFQQRPMASGLELARLDTQLDYLAEQISVVLKNVLTFIERLGLQLDDHYAMARHLSEDYLNKIKNSAHP